MLNYKEVLDYLNDNAKEYATKVKYMTEDEWKAYSVKNNIKDIEDVKKIIEIKKEQNKDKFIKLNDLVGFGRTKNTIHIHLLPKDAKFLLTKIGRKEAQLLLIDSLEKIKEMLNEEQYLNIYEIYAVSGIMKPPISTMFSELGFDVRVMKMEDAKKDRELGNFYERFKDKKNLGRAKITKEKIISEEWMKLVEETKIKLEQELEIIGNNIKQSAVQATQSLRFSSILDASDKILKENERGRNNIL